MAKELIATIRCAKCNEQKGVIYGVETGSSGVRHNVTEPETLQNAKDCPDCGGKLEVTRHG